MTDNNSLNIRRQAATPRGVATATQIFAQKAENAELWDVEGRRYVDFAGGIAVLNTGHCNPAVLARAAEQMARFTHTAYQVVPYEPYVELAEKLNTLAPGKSAKKSLFVTTGAEAVENAIKIARAYTGRSGVIAFSGGFHGRTNLTMGLTGKVAPYKKGFGPFPGEVYHLPFPMPMHGVTVDDTVAALEQLFRADIEPERVAAIIIEPVQGEGGFYIAPTELLQHLRQVCDRHGILLIADEIQSGFCRTGKLFAIEHSGVEPDMITMAKSMAGGFPLAGVVGKAEIMDAPEPGGLGGTYGGNPVSCAAALGVLDEIERLGLNQRAEALGNRVVDRIRAAASREDYLPIGDIRQLGAMIAFELVERHGTNIPNAAAAKALCAQALDNGLILLSCGVFGNSIRILVPLTASDAVVDEGMTILEQSLRQVATFSAAAE
ncbi:4-aminobutyrate--2-oxoglutarate transaminase [Hwanghaeella grinnelliae]|uniref:4-aminobutyrate--2-oxoglutarate transaminase n=1 Tax=Hwanghaeella grinnelliae TaxID=2500179 RepID=A0A437QYU1_9PROT|nr:4-aminobutyrate--2-oxoglutarate transaminase [Hwanghaeella grinnelliae]RVU39677.1 4-aminobutyrate--2-oxoglutarate transaminase [Hwanghaeella grinnelliae]